MKLQIMQFKCAKCGHYFKAPDLAFDSYGEFLLRTPNGFDEVYLNAFADKTYEEVNMILEENIIADSEPSIEVADVLKKIYGCVTCDFSVSGEPFKMGLFPKCPYCQSRDMAAWDEAIPVEFVEKFIPEVTHAGWSLLSKEQKRELVSNAVQCFYKN